MNNNRIRYNYEFLQKLCKENSIILLKDYINEKINRDSIIEGKCKSENCNEKFSKVCRNLYRNNNYGYYCDKCIKQIRRNKIDNTNLVKYGFKNALQNQEVKEKQEKNIFEKYGVINISQNEEAQKKKIETSLKNYGVNNPSQSQIIKNKKVETSLKNFGVQYPTQSQEIKDKTKNTCVEKYNCENIFQNEEIREKIKKSCLEKYGVENPSQNEDIQHKKVKTNIQKFGYRHPSQNSIYMDNLSKNAYKLKDYILPSGKTIKLQGYENYALDELLQDGTIEEDIINGCKNVPEIWYEDENGIKHRHYVDIFIPNQNKCIEIKSTWTAEKKKDCIFLKQEAGKSLGYNYEIWVYNGKSEKVECYK
jgi:hypothetical protein